MILEQITSTSLIILVSLALVAFMLKRSCANQTYYRQMNSKLNSLTNKNNHIFYNKSCSSDTKIRGYFKGSLNAK